MHYITFFGALWTIWRMSKQKLREANTLTKNEADASVVLGSYFQKVKCYNYLVFSHLAFFIITNICNTQARFPFHLLYSTWYTTSWWDLGALHPVTMNL